MRCLAALLLLLATACGRDLDLPEPAMGAAQPAPALLGRLAGDYQLSVLLEDDGAGFEAPAGFLRMMHLVDPKALEEERLLAIGFYASLLDGEPHAELACGVFLDATFDAGTASGVAQTFSCGGEDLGAESFDAVPVPGVAGLATSLTYSVCPESPPRELRGRRSCGFNPSISGVYQGTSTSCRGAVSEVQLALGFNGAEVMGFGYPWGTTALSGGYDPFAFTGEVEVSPFDGPVVACATFSLRELGELVELTLDERAPEADGSCGAPPEGCTGPHVVATRLIGGATEDCPLSIFQPALQVQRQTVREGGQRFLDVYASLADGSSGVLPPHAAEIVLRDPVSREPVEQIPGPPGATARFELGAACAGGERQYELWTRLAGFAGAEAIVAPVSCLFDDPHAAPPAIEGTVCRKPQTIVGSLLCVQFVEGNPATDDLAFWVTYCESSAACQRPGTICYADVGIPICSDNPCDAGSRDGVPGSNGNLWDPCNTITGRLDGASTPAGLCLPFGGAGGPLHPTCIGGGTLPVEAPCRLDAPSGADLCAPGLLCLPFEPYPEPPVPCACDSDCAGGQLCDQLAWSCVPVGTCVELCDGGSAPQRPGSPAGCSTPATTCHALEELPGAEHNLGICY